MCLRAAQGGRGGGAGRGVVAGRRRDSVGAARRISTGAGAAELQRNGGGAEAVRGTRDRRSVGGGAGARAAVCFGEWRACGGADESSGAADFFPARLGDQMEYCARCIWTEPSSR